MEQLILIGIILFVSSMLDAAARKKKREAAERLAEAPPLGGDPQVRSSRMPQGQLPSYDQDPSFDDPVDPESRENGGRVGSGSSEGLIPSDVWEEIQALARGGKVPAPVSPSPGPASVPARPRSSAPTRAPRPAPVPRSKAPRPQAPREVPTRTVPGPDVAAPEHAVHLTHAKYGKPVHDRLTGFDGTHKRRGLSEGAAELRRVLRGGGAAIRQAILLQEVLGPPVSLKDDPSAG